MAATTRLPSGTVTFLFSMIEEASALREEQGDGLAETFAAHGGVLVDRDGDTLFFAFTSCVEAVASAVRAQRALGERSHAGIGIHTGEATLGDDGYVGPAVQRAARLAALARAGEVLLSETSAALAEHDLEAGATLRRRGPVRLPGFDRPEPVFRVAADGLREEAPARLQPPSATTADLLEREAELEQVHSHVAAAAAGAGRLVAIEGGAGIGKTRLLAEARAAGVDAGLTALGARGAELEHDFAFGIVRQLFEPLLTAVPAHERAELLDGPAAPAGRLFGVLEPSAAEDEGEGMSFAMLHGLYWLTANLALRRPVLLAVDDLHWADAPSLRWLAHLQRRLDGLPLLVLVATRPPSQSRDPQLLLSVVGDSAGAVLRPGALGPASVMELARRVFGADPEPAFVSACRNATGGNPLFLEALLETLRSQGVRPVAEDARRVTAVGPEPVSRVVGLRLSRVSTEAAGLARALAVLGGHAELRHAAALSRQTQDDAAAAAAELVRAEILQDRHPLEFTHPVVRAALYDELPSSERLTWHRRAAAVLAEAPNVEPEQIAAHVVEAEPDGDPFVVETLRRAADRALQRGSSEVAVDFLRRALEEPPIEGERREVLRALGLAERLVDNDSAIVHMREALYAPGGPEKDPRLAIELGRALQRANRNPEAIDILRYSRELVAGDREAVRSITAELIGSAWWDPEDLELAEEELAAVRETELGSSRAEHLLRAILSYAEARVGDDRNLAVRLAEEARHSGYLVEAGSRALYSLGYTFTVAGRTDETIALFGEASDSALRRGDYVLASGCVLFRSLAHLYDGSLAAASEDVARMSELAELQLAMPYHAAFGAWAEIERGDLAAAERLLDAAHLPGELPANGQVMYFHLIRGRLRLEQGRLEDAIRDLLALGEHSKALGHRNPAFMPWQPYAGLALHAAGRSDEAVAIVVDALDRARSWGAPHLTGLLLRTLGMLEGGRSGEKRLAEAVDALSRSRARLEHARALVALGSALRQDGRSVEAREHLRQGLEIAHRTGARALAEEARTELLAAGARPRGPTVTGVEALTPTERRVAELAAGTMTNKAIAQALFVTPKTVEVHLSNAYRKLEISSRRELAGALT
jgi:DNA-binding CsgD family transcriptional regulator